MGLGEEDGWLDMIINSLISVIEGHYSYNSLHFPTFLLVSHSVCVLFLFAVG